MTDQIPCSVTHSDFPTSHVPRLAIVWAAVSEVGAME